MSRLLQPCWLAFLLAGCHALHGPSQQPPGVETAAAAPSAARSAAQPGSQVSSQPAPSRDDVETLVAEIEATHPLPPAERQQLLSDLRQADPSLRPLIIQVLRAHRNQQTGGSAAPQAEGTPSSTPTPSPVTARLERTPPVTVTAVPLFFEAPAGPASTPLAATPVVTPILAEDPIRADLPVESAVANVPLATEPASPVSPPAEQTPGTVAGASTAAPPTEKAVPALALADAASDSAVRTVAHTEPMGESWEESLKQAIAGLEKEIGANPQAPASRQASLRVLYLLDGRRDDAMKAISGASPAVGAFWTSQMYGMAAWLDEEKTPSETQRATAARQQFGEALAHLGEMASLEVRNLFFCTRVNGYGSVVPFKKNEFTPEQEVLLYAEVENMGVERSAEGCRTALRSSYQIFDATGRLVDKHEFGATEETCLNPRRDYYIGYRLWLPARIYAGPHTLKLTVEDLIGNKVGQSEIEFTVAEAEE